MDSWQHIERQREALIKNFNCVFGMAGNLYGCLLYLFSF